MSVPSRAWQPNDLWRSSAVDYVLDNSTVIFTTLRNMGSMTGVPYIGEAANAALRIVNLAKAIRDNSNAYMELAKDVCGLLYTILNECQEMERNHQTIPQRVENHIRGLISNLNEIQKFIEEKITRNGLQKLIKASKDIKKIARYREQLRQSLDIFGIQTNISTQQNLQQMAMNIQQQREEMRADRLHNDAREHLAREELASQQEEIRVALLRQARQDRLEAEQHAQQDARRRERENEQEAKRLQCEEDRATRLKAQKVAQQEAQRQEGRQLEGKRLEGEERERKSQKYRATCMAILRIQEDDLRKEKLEIEEFIRKENLKKVTKETKWGRDINRLMREVEEPTIQAQQLHSLHSPYAQPQYQSLYLVPVSLLGFSAPPYGYSYDIFVPYNPAA